MSSTLAQFNFIIHNGTDYYNISYFFLSKLDDKIFELNYTNVFLLSMYVVMICLSRNVLRYVRTTISLFGYIGWCRND